eukprot:361512-Chlamydomonas_euryale.AAC.5
MAPKAKKAKKTKEELEAERAAAEEAARLAEEGKHRRGPCGMHGSMGPGNATRSLLHHERCVLHACATRHARHGAAHCKHTPAHAHANGAAHVCRPAEHGSTVASGHPSLHRCLDIAACVAMPCLSARPHGGLCSCQHSSRHAPCLPARFASPAVLYAGGMRHGARHHHLTEHYDNPTEHYDSPT